MFSTYIKIWGFVLKTFKVHVVIGRLIKKQKISDCYAQVTAGDTVFHEEASVSNFQNKPDRIRIGINTHIRGELLIFAYDGEIQIGDYCYVGEGTRIWSGDKVIIGNHVLISHNVNIIDSNSHEIKHLERAEGYKSIITNGHPKTKGSILTKPITIHDHAWISFNATLLRGVTIGEGAIVGACAVVTKDVPPWTVVAGNPARIVREIPENER